MKRLPAESDANAGDRTSRPIVDPGIGRFIDSIRSFAAQAGLSEGALRMYLRGESFPSLDRLDQIAAAAGRPPAWFIGVDVGPEAAPQPATTIDERALRFAPTSSRASTSSW